MSNRRYFKDISNGRKNGDIKHTDDEAIAEWFSSQARWQEVDAPKSDAKADDKPKAAPKANAKTAAKAADTTDEAPKADSK